MKMHTGEKVKAVDVNKEGKVHVFCFEILHLPYRNVYFLKYCTNVEFILQF